MKRVRMVLAYDGTNYCGWQLQPNGITIEEVLNQALSELLREPVVVIGASRTDSGVHAEGNVAVFDTENRMPADKICFALNQRLPEDIRVLKSEEVPLDWHPRKQNCVKTYEYRILNRKIAMPTLRLYSHFCYFSLDVEKMQKGASYLIGEHDFKSFCTVRSQAEETVRTVYSLDVKKEGDMIIIRITGSGFLYNMVRIIAGTLMKVGMGVYPPEHVEEILDARNRQAAGPTAPAQGLTLISMEYEKELRQEIIGKNKEWFYRLIQTEVPQKKKAYLVIERCVESDYDRLLTRVTHQAVRNGAEEVYVCDKEQEDRIQPGKAYGYYQFQYIHDMLVMKKDIFAGEEEASEKKAAKELISGAVLSWDSVQEEELPEYCEMVNEIFYHVPNSAAMTCDELKAWYQGGQKQLLWLKKNGQKAGFLMLVEKTDEMEVDEIGILEEFRGQGLAEAALRAAEDAAKEKGMKRISLIVSSVNVPAKSLYEKMGYQAAERSSRWYMTSSDGYPGRQAGMDEILK